jgi:hypothetical protein
MSKNTRVLIARLLVTISSAARPNADTLATLRSLGLVDNTVDTSWRGCGNRAERRSGGEIWRGCDCVICVEYGGDCANVMRQEWRNEAHREQRGVKTRHFNALPKSPDERKGAAYQTLFGNS